MLEVILKRISTRILVGLIILTGIASYFMGYIPSIEEFKMFLNSSMGSVIVLYGAPFVGTLLVGAFFGTSLSIVVRGYSLGMIISLFLLSVDTACIAEGKSSFLGDLSPLGKIFFIVGITTVATLLESPAVSVRTFFISRKEKKEK